MGEAGQPLPYSPRPVTVGAARDGTPDVVGGCAVAAVREGWLVEDRWWTPRPLQRRYFELVLADGGNLVVFFDPRAGRWFQQRA